ncbi:MAG TPA: maleylpyruvate isomerase family mycothiol-dependent enzyme [Streptosporangiaceae bacterium]
MAASSPWPLIHAEREALANDLATLTAEQWATPSLCSEWTVRDAFGHVIATARMTPPAFFAALAKAGFRFNTMTANRIAAEATATPAEALAEFRKLLTATTHPPGPVEAMLGEAIIHGEDIRRPLGIKREYPAEAVIRVADFNKGSNLLIGSKRRIDGLTLKAADQDWQTGSGPEVTGPALSLVLAMTGRTAALDDLSGDGLATLRSRM